MILVVIILFLLIITGLITVLIIKRKDNNDNFKIFITNPEAQNVVREIHHYPPEITENYPWRRHPRWWYRRGITPGPADPYYPQSLIQEHCLNECCDYEKCVAGYGCNWKGLDNRWQIGNPTQCLQYRKCVNNSKKKDNIERHLECAEKAKL